VPVRGRSKIVIASVLVSLVGVAGPLVDVAEAGSRGGGCSPRKTCTAGGDTAAPTVSISTPATGATVSGSVAVSGSAADNVSVARIDVALDNGPFQLASGTTNWSALVDMTAAAEGAHTLTARATDGAGRTGTRSISVTVSSAGDPTVIRNPAVTDDILVSGRGQMASLGSLSVLIYQERWSHKPWAYFQDETTGTATHVALPVDQPAGNDWAFASWTLTSPDDLWIFSGGGPVYARQYRLSGSPLPSSAVLVGVTTFGDADSRAQDVTVLSSGTVVGVWHQQGQLGPQSQGVAYRRPSAGWSTLSLSFMPTASSSQAVVQHPVDGSIWLFIDPDAWSSIGAAHLTETDAGLRVDWTNPAFISEADGAFDADPENPDLVAVPDPSTGTVALAYQSAVRQRFVLDGRALNGSYVAVARISADAAKSFISLPEYVERVSPLGLVVTPGETWLAYRPIDPADLSFDDLYISRHRDGAWTAPTHFGTLWAPYDQVAYAVGRPLFAARLRDGALHVGS
jgi:hypothetical protein